MLSFVYSVLSDIFAGEVRDSQGYRDARASIPNWIASRATGIYNRCFRLPCLNSREIQVYPLLVPGLLITLCFMLSAIRSSGAIFAMSKIQLATLEFEEAVEKLKTSDAAGDSARLQELAVQIAELKAASNKPDWFGRSLDFATVAGLGWFVLRRNQHVAYQDLRLRISRVNACATPEEVATLARFEDSSRSVPQMHVFLSLLHLLNEKYGLPKSGTWS